MKLVNIDTTNLSENSIKKLKYLIWKYRDIFHDYDGKPG